MAPIARTLDLLRSHFSKTDTGVAGASLAISAGRNGARLSHSHAMQYVYVEQSLLLWQARNPPLGWLGARSPGARSRRDLGAISSQAILSQLPRLYALAESDLLHGADYRLRDTGQGLHRVQGAPEVARFMRHVLGELQRQTGSWVGSSAVHLGDNDVPNALVWLDKYTQARRIARGNSAKFARGSTVRPRVRCRASSARSSTWSTRSHPSSRARPACASTSMAASVASTERLARSSATSSGEIRRDLLRSAEIGVPAASRPSAPSVAGTGSTGRVRTTTTTPGRASMAG